MDNSILFNKLVENINTLLQQYNKETGVVITGRIGEIYPRGEIYFRKFGLKVLKEINTTPPSYESAITSMKIDDETLFCLKPHINIQKCEKFREYTTELAGDVAELDNQNKTDLEIETILGEKYGEKYNDIINNEYMFYETCKYTVFMTELYKLYSEKLIEENKGNKIFKYKDFCEIIKLEYFSDLTFEKDTGGNISCRKTIRSRIIFSTIYIAA
jgi:hypothetical protein